MKNLKTIMLLSVLAIMLGAASGCQVDAAKAVSAGADIYKGATASDAELKEISKQMRAQGDAANKVAPDNSKYAQRIKKLMGKHMHEDGLDLNFKVYMVQEINANATADGSIRVYAGLMDKMNDAELIYVLGHEIGHVAKGHTLDATRVAYTTSGAVKAAGAAGGVVGALSSTQLGALLEEVVNAQFSQSQEYDADAYAMAFMKKYKYPVKGAVTALRKIEALGDSGGLLSSHPNSGDRATRMEQQINAK